ncbi:MAG: hypothetical protein GZ091_03160 [Paludibacter sp.]|nr:hypothetical protein [Paludibacter sp.]
MRKITFLILFCFLIININAKSPHGNKFNIDCTVCHVTKDWKIIKSGFDHNKTNFPLTGQHKMTECKKCHQSLLFSNTKTKCNECHTDVHQGTVGKECERCHTTNSWIVTNTRALHEEAGFPLRGAHKTADCNRCHTSASDLRFENIRTDCFACHKDKYFATAGKTYDHKVLGFDTDCARCHNMVGMDWNTIGKGFDHSFFTLTGGHNIDCVSCHKEGDYRKRLSTDCTSCHSGKKSEATTVIPAHSSIFAKYSCAECHTTQTWNTVKFKQHDAFYGIYSGKHKGTWTRCTDCHKNDAGYDAKNTCSRCHNDIQHL